MIERLRPALLVATLLVGGCYSGLGTDTAAVTGSTGGTEPTSAAETGAPTSTSTSTTGENGTTTGEGQTSEAPPMTSSGEASTTTGVDDTTTTGVATTMTTSGSTGEPPPPNPDVPDGFPYCEPAKAWDPAWKQLEEDVLVIVNEKRAQGADCGGEGVFGPAGPLTMHPALRCAARMHSKDMADRDFFSHTNPDGESPWDRIGKTGYGAYTNAGENIAAGSPTAAGTMDQWMNSDGHCANIMNPDFEHIGVGYHPGGQYGHLWTQVFGAQ